MSKPATRKAKKGAPEESQKSTTPPPSKAASTPDPAQSAILALLGPLLKFHEPVEGASGDDVRLFWDIRIVRGEDEKVVGHSGTSTLIGLLRDSNLRLAPHVVTTEVIDKVAKPLADMLQNMSNEKAIAVEVPAEDPERLPHTGALALPNSEGLVQDASDFESKIDDLDGDEPEGSEMTVGGGDDEVDES